MLFVYSVLFITAVSKADSDDVNASFLMREFLQCVVFVADSTYSESRYKLNNYKVMFYVLVCHSCFG